MDFDLMKQAFQRQDRVVSIHAADEAASDITVYCLDERPHEWSPDFRMRL